MMPKDEMTPGRITAIIVTSPIWIIGGILAILMFSPVLLVMGMLSLMNYAACGDWMFYDK